MSSAVIDPKAETEARFVNCFADISEVRVYSRRLGDEEVAQRYEETCARYHACS